MEILVLAALLIIREYFGHKERKDLYTRLMAKDLDEMSQSDVVDTPPPPDVPPEYKPLSEASDEEFSDIIEEQLGRTGLIKKAKKALKRKING